MRLVMVVTSTLSSFAALLVDLLQQVVDLAGCDAHLERRVDQPRGADQLFDDHAFAFNRP